MNTGKQINAMVVVLFLLLISIGAYSIWDPFRADTKEARQQELTINRASNTFALNCRLCHGDRGQGGSVGGRLPAAPALDSERLQGITSGVFTQADYNADVKLVRNTITCGRIGTAMPTWGATQGGTLSVEQIRQLTEMITKGQWADAQKHADEIDSAATLDATVQMPSGTFVASDATLTVSNAEAFTPGQYIRIGEERLRILPLQLQVERGDGGTEAADHDRGVTITPVTPARELDPAPTLGEAAAAGDTVLITTSAADFQPGDIVQVDDERVRVTAVQRGIPTTQEFLVRAVGREPTNLLVTGSNGITSGMQIRVGGELMTVNAVGDDGDAGIELDRDADASATQMSINQPTFMRDGYVVRIGDELVRVGEAVTTNQALGETIGPAQTRFEISGTAGIDPGSVIRIDGEQMQVLEIITPTIIDIDRAQQDTTAAAHNANAKIIRVIPPAQGEEDAQPTEEDTLQTLLEGVDDQATSAVVSGSNRIAADGTYRIDNEIVTVTTVHAAGIQVERGVEGTKKGTHARRGEIFVGNLFDVERGFAGTVATPHAAGDSLLFTELEVDREVNNSKLADHQKGDEVFLGNDLIVDRGVLSTEPADHPNGEIVYNFPTAPDSPATTGVVDGQAVEVCGQFATVASVEEVPTPAPGAAEVTVQLHEFQVDLDPTSTGTGDIGFFVADTGTAPHNFRVIQSDLPPDQLPLASDGLTVDETQVNVVTGFSTAIQPGDQQPVGANLPAGNYVLICNVPTHYESGMHTEFTVTP